VYKAVNSIAHLTFKKPRTKKGYESLIIGNYLPRNVGDFLKKYKAKS